MGVVVGFLLATIPGRREVARLEARVGTLELQLARADEVSSGGAFGAPLPGLGGMLRGARLTRRHARSVATEAVVAADGGVAQPGAVADPRGVTASGTSTETQPFDADGGVPRRQRRGPLERFDMAVDAQRMRASQTREALREDAELDDAKMAAVDRAVARMNDRLAPYADELVQLTMAGERPRARDMLSLTRDVTGILSDAQAEMDHIVGDERMDRVDDSAAQIWNYVDLEKFRPAVEAYSAREGN